MATISRVHTFSTGEVLTAANLNGELNLIVTAINGNIDAANVDTSAIPTLTATQTLTNKTLTSPKIGTAVLDTAGAELIKLTATGSAVNELTIANAANGNSPTISSTGDDTNIDLTLSGKGTGKVIVSGDLQVSGDDLFMGTNTSGHVLIADGTNFNPTALSGDVTVSSSGTTAIESGVIVNADVNASAAIAQSKLALAVTTSEIAASTLVTESEGIGSNDNDTTLPTSAAVKDYVDTQILTEDTLAELNDTTIGSLASGHLLIYDGTDSWDNKAVTGDVLIASDGTTSINSDVIVNADIKSDAAIADSKLATISTSNKVSGSAVQLASTTAIEDSSGLQIKSAIAGTGLSLSSQVLSVDAAQTQITSVGTLSSLTVGGNIVSDTDGTDDLGLTGTRWRYVYADNIAITNDLAVTEGGTGASDAATARTNLGLAIGSDIQAYDAELQALSGLTPTDGNFIVGNGSTFVTESAATVRTSLGLGSIATQASDSVSITGGSVTGITDITVADGGTGSSSASGARTNLGLSIGSDIQAYDAKLAAIAGLAVTDGNIIVGNGSTWVAESAGTARTSLGLGSIATQAADNVSISGGSLTGMTSYSGGSFSGTTGAFSGDVTLSKDAPYLIMTDSGTGGGTSKIAVDAVGSNHGFYFQADGSTNHVILESNGDFKVDADTLYIDASADRVGVNNASPQVDFHVDNASTNGVARISTSHSSSYAQLQLVNQSGNYWYQTLVQTDNSYRLYNGSDRLIVDSDGHLGLGGTPTSNGTGSTVLNVNATTGGSTIHLTNNTTGTTNSDGALLVQSGSDLLFINRESGNLKLRTADTDRLTVTSDGNLLVGGTSQSGTANRAAVFSAGKFGLSIIDTTAQAAGVGGALNLGGNYRSSGDAQAFARIEAVKENATDANYAYGMAFSVTPNGASSFSTEGVRITSAGRVGINIDDTKNAMLYVEQDSSSTAGGIQIGRSGGGLAWAISNVGSNLRFGMDSTADGTVDIDSVTFDYQGLVGVGTSSPTEKMDVTGAVKASAAASNWGYSASFFDRYGNDTRVVAGATSGNSSNIAFWTYNSGTQTEKARILSSGGITFGGATAAASALDYYEEGTFSPALGNGSASYSEQLGSYTRIGNVVFINVSLTWTGGPTSGNIVIGTLPFTSSSTLQSHSPLGQVANNSLTVTGYEIAGYISANSTIINFTNQTSGTGSTNKTYEAAGTIRITGHYFV